MAGNLLMSPTSAAWTAMASGLTGIEVPKGDPTALSKAATAWGHVGEGLDREAQVIERAALTAALVDWLGIASIAFASSARRLTVEMQRGAHACGVAGLACRGLATAIHDAQDDARAAIAAAMDALDRIKQAQRAVDRAHADAVAADHQAGEARALGEIAKQVPAGLGVAAAQAAQQHEQAARHAGEAARGRAAVARGQLEDAHRDLERAQRRGQMANQHAEDAGRHAAGVLHDIAHRAKGPARRTPPPMPISHTPGVDPGLLDLLAKYNPSIGFGTAHPGGVPVDSATNPLDVAGNAIPAARLIEAIKRAKDARRAALGPVPTGGPLLHGPYAGLNRNQIATMRERHVANGPDPHAPPGTAANVLRNGGRALNVIAPVAQGLDNHRKHMPLLENAMRTGASAALGGQAAAAGATLCSPSVAGSVVCGAAAGYIGSKVGDFAGGVAYKAVDAGYQEVIKPLGGPVADAASGVEHAVSAGLKKIGIG